jgi:hypothetical protein
MVGRSFWRWSPSWRFLAAHWPHREARGRKGHLWINHLASIQSDSDSQTDPMSCSFDPSSKLGKRVLAVCNEWGGEATHGCWIRGTFVVNRGGERQLTGVFEVQKSHSNGRLNGYPYRSL